MKGSGVLTMTWLVVALISGLTIAVAAGYLVHRIIPGTRIGSSLGGLRLLRERLPAASGITWRMPPADGGRTAGDPFSEDHGRRDGEPADDSDTGRDLETSDVAAAEARVLDDVLLELSHRTKNQLSTILGIIERLRRAHPEAKAFCDNLTARIHGIAVCQDVLVACDWGAPSIQDLAEAILSRHFGTVTLAAGGDRSVEPRHIRLEPRSVQNLGLVLNEIAHWAVAHAGAGAVSAADVHIARCDHAGDLEADDAHETGDGECLTAEFLTVVVTIPAEAAVVADFRGPPGSGEFADILSRQAFGAPVEAHVSGHAFVYAIRLPAGTWRIEEAGSGGSQHP